jgi:predicted hydrocarbon binding protein
MRKPILFLTILIITTISLVIFTHNDAVKMAYQCGSFRLDNTCITKTVNELIDSNPEKAARVLTQISSLRRLSLLGGDFRIYSSSLHYLGYTFFIDKYSFETIGDFCPPLIKDGCVHGYVMEYINMNSIDAGVKLCDMSPSKRIRLGCIHALGHSYLEFNNQTAEEANKKFCNNYSNLDHVACISGLLHEHSKFGEGVGHENYYQRSHSYNNISCDGFTGGDYTVCYGAQGSFRQYFPESESIKSTYEVCDQAKTQEARKMCRFNAVQRLDISRGYSSVTY